MVKVEDGMSTVAEYQYGGKYRPIESKGYASGSFDHDEHFYLSEANQVLEVRKDSSANAHKQFTWGKRYINVLVLRTRDMNSNSTIDETLYAVQDANWDVTALVDASGTVVERFRYDPYGRNLVLDDDFTVDPDGQSDYDWEYRFTSREYDTETGLHYFRARYWHPDLGRFIGRDPLEYIDGASFYAGYFVPNSLDPSGRAPGDKHFGLPQAFWNWYHQSPYYDDLVDLTEDEAKELYKEWDRLGRPNPKTGRRSKGGKGGGWGRGLGRAISFFCFWRAASEGYAGDGKMEGTTGWIGAATNVAHDQVGGPIVEGVILIGVDTVNQTIYNNRPPINRFDRYGVSPFGGEDAEGNRVK